MRLSSKAIAACAMLSVSPLSLAEVYVGGGGVMSTFKYDNVKRGFGPDAFVGYRGETVPLMVELGYISSGQNKVDNPVTLIDPTGATATVYNPELSFSGELVSVGYFGRFDSNGSGAYGKIGYYTGKSKFEGTDASNTQHGSISETSNGFMFGFGVDWMLNRSFGLRFDLSSLVNTKAIPYSDQQSSITSFGVGVVFAFGGPESSYASAYPRTPAPAPVYLPPVYSPAIAPAPVEAPPPPPVAEAPAQMPPPVVAQTPAPAVASAITVGTAQLVPGAVLRSGPSMKSTGIKTMPDGGSVKLVKRETNTEGPWWMVQLDDGTTGWMIEWGLTRISKH